MRSLAALVMAGLVLGMSAPHSEGAPPPGTQPAETVASNRLAAGEARSLALVARPGAYVRGTLAVGAGRVRLDLVAADGRPIRRLADDVEGRTVVHFVAPGGPARLVLTALEDGTAHLTTEAIVAPPKAVSPPPRLTSSVMAALARSVEAGGGTEAFWAEVARRGTPLVEVGGDGQVLLTFLARGNRANVRLVGAPSGDHEWLSRLAGSDVWFKSFTVPADTRLSYRIAPDVPAPAGSARERRIALLATAAADPLNHHPWPADAPDAFNQESTLELPAAPVQPGLENLSAPRGTFTRFRLSSAGLGNTRSITLYTPAGFDPADWRNQLLILFDAKAYLTKVPTPRILDALTADGRLPPTLAVFVSEIDAETRTRELPGNPAFADFLARDLLPAIQARSRAAIPPARTILAGSSYGGLAATTVALTHPELFGNVIAMSGSFWWHPERLAELVARATRRDLRFHMSAGLFEGAHQGSDGILETTRRLRERLKGRGYPVTGRDYAGGHDYLVWRGALADGLLAIAGARTID
ncbi:enterochelin esterase [Methylobacterium brachiatum]